MKQMLEGVDYYTEDGKVVFTEKFLQERGACCKSGCRHCPWKYKKELLSGAMVAQDAVNIKVPGSSPG
jgi:hypothetical protein